MRLLIPPFILEKYKNNERHGVFNAVSLFVDLSGFTRMSESLMSYGTDGAEILASVVQDIFDPLVDMVRQQNGFVTGFAGDAFTALFPLSDSKDNNIRVFRRGLAAACDILGHNRADAGHKTPVGTFHFDVKMGLAAGDVKWGILRSDEQPYRHTFYFRGTAIDLCASAEHKAERGHLVIDRSVFPAIAPWVECEPLSANHYRFIRSHLPPPELANTASMPATDVFDPQALNPADMIAFFPPEIVYSQTPGEFRNVVTVFISIKGLDSDAAIRAFMGPVFDLVVRYRGMLTRLDFGDKGNTLLLYWGAPIHFENVVDRALNFVLDLKKAVGVDFRVGVTYRPMYAGLTGTPQQSDFACYGVGVNLAVRQMMAADWGEIFLDQMVMRAIGSQFETVFRGQMAFRGFEDEEPVYQLKGLNLKAHTILYNGHLIGREAELARLQNFVAPILTADERRFAGMIVVRGEAGIGKSRLIYEFREQLKQQHLVWWCYCVCDEILRQSLNPFKAFLRTFFHQSTAQSLEVNRKQFDFNWDHLLGQLQMVDHVPNPDETLQRLDRIRSLISWLLDLSDPDPAFLRLDARLRKTNLLNALKQFFKALTWLRPVVISMEDIQWIDADSRELLQLLMTNMAAFPVVIICATRPVEDDSVTKWSGADIPFEQIELNVLSRPGLMAMTQQILGNPVDGEVIDFLVSKTHGNPFFVEQLLLSLKEGGFLYMSHNGSGKASSEPGRYRLKSAAKATIPTTIQDTLISRLDRLPMEVKHVVQTASVLGREFDIPVLERMLSEDHELGPKMKTAVRAAIWVAQSDISYIFKHALMRDAAYNMQLRSRLRFLHGLASDSIEQIYEADLRPHYGDLVVHLERSDDIDRAIHYLKLAADYASENYQNADALDYYSRLISHLQHKFAHASASERAGLYADLVLGMREKMNVLKLVGQDAALEKLMKAALDLAMASGDARLVGEIHLCEAGFHRDRDKLDLAAQQYGIALDYLRRVDARDRIQVIYSGLGLIAMFHGRYDEAMDYFEQRLALARALQDTESELRTISQLGLVYKMMGEYDRALEFFEKRLVKAEENDDLGGIYMSLGNIGNIHALRGNFEQAETCFLRSLEILEKMGDLRRKMIMLGNLSTLNYNRGSYDKALIFARDMLSISQELNDMRGMSLALGRMCSHYMAEGRYDLVRPHLDRKLELDQKLNLERELVVTYNHLGELNFHLGKFDDAIHYFEKELEIGLRHQNHFQQVMAYTGLGLVASEQGAYNQALAYFQEALAGAEHLNSDYLRCSQVYMAEVYHRMADYHTAADMNGKGLELALSCGARDLTFRGYILQAQLAHRQGELDQARDILENLLPQTDFDQQRARIHFELFKVISGKEREDHRQRAYELYERLYQQTGGFEFGRFLQEMQTT